MRARWNRSRGSDCSKLYASACVADMPTSLSIAAPVPAPGSTRWSIATEDVAVSQRAYFASYASLDPIPYQHLVPGRPYLRHELYDGDGAFYREFLQPQGIDELMILLIEASGGMRAWLTLARKSTQPPFTATDCSFVRSLTPHFTTALTNVLRSQDRRVGARHLSQCTRRLACGTLLIDQSGRSRARRSSCNSASRTQHRVVDRRPSPACGGPYRRQRTA